MQLHTAEPVVQTSPLRSLRCRPGPRCNRHGGPSTRSWCRTSASKACSASSRHGVRIAAVRIGDTYTDEKGAAALRALFATGLFKDVRIETQGDVARRASSRSVRDLARSTSSGLQEFDKDALTKALSDFGIGEGLPFDKALADRAEQELKRQYLTRSLYGAEVVTTVTPHGAQPRQRHLHGHRGRAAKIREIRIVGNKAFSREHAAGLFELDDGGWLNWYTKSDRYSRAKLNADLETLRAYYLNRGYLEFEIDSTQVAISPDKQDITITINVHGRPALHGHRRASSRATTSARKTEFKTLVTIKPGEPLPRRGRSPQTTKAFVDRFGNFGYAFAQGRCAAARSTAPTSRVALTLRRRSAAPRLRAPHQHRRQHAHARRGGPARVPPVRVALVRRRARSSCRATASTGSATSRDVNVDTRRGAGHARPGRPDDHGQGKAHRQPHARRGLLVGRQARRCRRRSSRRTCSARATTSASRSTPASTTARWSLSTVDPYFTIDGISRAIDVYYRTYRPLNSQGERATRSSRPARDLRFGVPFCEVRHGVLRRRHRANRDQGRRREHAARRTINYVNEFGRSEQRSR